jgi:hypothetical protein
MTQENDNQNSGVDEAWVKQIVSELERAAPKETAQIELLYEEEDELKIVANKAGFLRLGLESLSAAIAPLKPKAESIQTDWKYLFIKDSPTISQVWRTETVQLLAAPAPTTWEKFKNFVALVFLLALLLFLVASTAVGCFTILRKF